MLINKTDGARRQIETAIDLYFSEGDSLSTYTLAFASFKMLFNLYPHRKTDDFATRIDEMITKEGWRAMSSVANFLKHADRDPDAVLKTVHPEQAAAVIGLAVILYGRIEGDLTIKMMGFDSWTETIAEEELGIAELDENVDRAEAHRRMIRALAALPYAEKMKAARKHYAVFIEQYPRIKALTDESATEGRTITEILDRDL